MAESHETIEVDFNDPSSLDGALKSADAVYVTTSPSEQAHQQYLNLFTSAHNAGVTHVVKLSALNAAFDAPSIILRNHAESDRVLQTYGMRHTILRPYYFFQNILHSLPIIEKYGAFSNAVGSAKLGMIDVRDIGRVAAHAIMTGDNSNKILELTGPELLTLDDVAEMLATRLDHPVVYQPIDAPTAINQLRMAGFAPWTANAIAEIHMYFATGAYGLLKTAAIDAANCQPHKFKSFLQHEFIPKK